MAITAQIKYSSNPRYHADGIPVYFGSSQDARLVYDAANDEWTVQTKNASGTFVDRLRVEANTDTPDVDAVDLPIKWTAGRAVTAGDYSIGRDADGTNQLHLNVPTGATFEWSVNDVAVFTWDNTGLLAANASGPAFLNEAATNTNPTLVPNRADPDTGLGWQAADDIALIVGGSQVIRADATNLTFYRNIQSSPSINIHMRGGYLEMEEMAAPGAGAANTVRVYAVVDGGSLTDLAAVFQDGTVDIFAQEV